MSSDSKYDIDSDTERNYSLGSQSEPKNMQDLTANLHYIMQNIQSKFDAMASRIGGNMEDVGHRVDDLEKTIADVMTQSGIELTL